MQLQQLQRQWQQHQQLQLLLLLLLACSSAAFGMEPPLLNRSAAIDDFNEAESSMTVQVSTKNLIDRLLQNYTSQNSPHGDDPTTVNLGIYINSFYSISEQTMDYSVNIYLRQQWLDPRLSFNRTEVFGNKEFVKLEDRIWEKLWVPDVFFRNEKRAAFHHVTIPNRMVNLYPNGTIWYVMKISATLSCMMQLHKYPLDTQTCPMMLESFGYTMKTVIFKWLEGKSVESTEGLSMPQFILKDSRMRDCSQNYTTGSYPCLEVGFVLQRDIMYFLIQVYIPTILIVILSWVAFWINTEAIPARVSLGLLTVLTMTTQSSGAGQSLPRVSYIKAIDVWMSVCLVFVFASLLEFAVVNVYSRRDPMFVRHMRAQSLGGPQLLPQVHPMLVSDAGMGNGRSCSIRPSDAYQYPPLLMTEDQQQQQQNYYNYCPNYVNKARRIDKISRRLFPLSFLIFNVIYWVMYLVVK